MPNSHYDVVVVGSGPNGLTAAALAARRGLSTIVFEARDHIGGGLRSAELTEPGLVHDVCSSVHPMAVASPAFLELRLEQHGLEWITPHVAAAHPLDNGEAVLLHNDAERTAESLGEDRTAYQRTIGAVARAWPRIESDLLGPIGFPSHPVAYAKLGLPGLLPARLLARRFSTTRGRALFAGCAAHSILPFSAPGSSAFALALAAVGHVHGWPVARGGSQSIANALVKVLRASGGEIVTGAKIERHEQLPTAGVIFFDTSPRAMAAIMRDQFPRGFAGKLTSYRYGPGAFKLDWALSAPIPWKSRECLEAATVHVGGTFEEVAAAEAAPWRGECAERPFVLVTQPSVFDQTRAPAGRHTAWGYCHVPNGSTVDMTTRIEAQVERFAPGFRDLIVARATRGPATIESENANLVGGDVGGGSNDLLNLFFRPTWRRYATPVPGVFLCSAATPPGAGVHGMCGYHAARAALAGDRNGSDRDRR
ncbi:MAG TPA: NAD(P)/FAD-dependent oxidoreductase [Gemmatimonadaceae bacterium]